MATVDELLSSIAAFCEETGISEATFATRAVNDGKFVARLRDGAGVTVKTVERVHAYIATERDRAAAATSAAGREGVSAS
jgi:hypothetical protein